MTPRKYRTNHRGLADAALANQQGEAGRFMQQAPFERGQSFAMGRAQIQSVGCGRELKRGTAQAKVMMIHVGAIDVSSWPGGAPGWPGRMPVRTKPPQPPPLFPQRQRGGLRA